MRRAGVHLTPKQIEDAKRLYADGWTYPRIGEKLGFRAESIKRALDADYADRRRTQIREARQLRAFTQNRSDRAGRENATAISVKEDAAARLAEIPADTRSITGMLAGDPLPGRSALDKRQQA